MSNPIVTFSPFAGAGAQFFDSNGVPLAGGFLYTYASGTTTQQATYTSPTGAVANSNPIVLGSDGRTPQEIWLLNGYSYKFVLQSATGTQIGSYDNIPNTSLNVPIINDASSVAYEEGYSVTAGNFVVGNTYLITSVGTTNFTSIGATSNTVGIYFVATGVGSGTGTAQLSRTVQSKLQEFISVKDFGAVGNYNPSTGLGTDDTASINAAISACASTSSTLYFPNGNYKITSNLNISVDSYWEGKVYPVGFGNVSTPASATAVTISGSGTSHYNLYVSGTSAEVTNYVIAILVTAYEVALYEPTVSTMGIGIFFYPSVTSQLSVYQPNLYANATGVSFLAPNLSQQTNIINIFGGSINNNSDYTIYYGDTRFPTYYPTTVPSNQPYGSNCTIVGAQLMGTGIVSQVTGFGMFGCNFEYASYGNGKAIQLNNYVRGATFDTCYFSGFKYAVYSNGGDNVSGISMKNTTYNAITVCGLYISGSVYPYWYENGLKVSSCFANGTELHTGQSQVSYTNCSFKELNWTDQGIIKGVQTTDFDTGNLLSSGIIRTGTTVKTNSKVYGRTYTSPKSNIGGFLNGYQFTFGAPTDVYGFNAGDAYTLTGQNPGVINSINYETGVINLSDAFSGSNVSANISQVATPFTSVFYSSASPTTGTWAVGDIAWNSAPAVGSPKGWVCTVAGTPGTWVSMGNL
jgi:hypothetical protein